MNKIIDAVEDVFEQVGGGLSESCYNKCMALKLRQNFDVVDAEMSVPLVY